MNHCPRILSFVLIGWYLLIPPPMMVQNDALTDFNAPLPKWVELRAFDSADGCEAVRRAYRETPPESMKILLGSEEAAEATMFAAECVSSDDLRLRVSATARNSK